MTHAEPGARGAEHRRARDIGAASSTVAFFRSLGGTIGVAVLGAVLSNRVSALLGAVRDGRDHETSRAWTPPAAAAVRAAYGDAIGLVFLIAAIGSLVTLMAVLFIKEVPLRTTVGGAPEEAAVSPAAPSGELRTSTA